MSDGGTGTSEYAKGHGSVSSDEDRIAYLAGEAGDSAGARLTPSERAELQAIRELLADPSVWAEPAPSLEDRVVAAVTAEAAKSKGQDSPLPLPSRIDGRRSARRDRTGAAPRRLLVLSGAIAAAVVVAVALTVRSIGGGPAAPRMTAALSAAAPGEHTSASATFTRTSAGWRVELHTRGLPRLDHGRFYEAWMKNDAGVLVAIGTFNQGPDVTLWSGVSPTEFGTITITAQEANGNPASSGQRVLVGTIAP